MSKKKSLQTKKNQLQEYIYHVQKEINDNATKTLKPLYTDADMISIDDNIHPVLMVMASDILGGNHDTIIGMAASYKITGITVKSMQCGETPPINIMDIGKTIPIVQGLFASIPLINSAVGSYIECIGKNMNAQCNEISFNYGVAMNIGSNFANPGKSSVLRSIGINIGNITQCIDIDDNYKQFLLSVKTLPNNKYTKRLKEYVTSILPKKTIPSKIPDTMLPFPKKKSSLKKDKATKQKESDTINIDVTSTKEDFEKAIKQISEKVPEASVTFCAEDDTETVKKNKERKSKTIPKEKETNEITFNTGDK